jgi:hypothetical protein
LARSTYQLGRDSNNKYMVWDGEKFASDRCTDRPLDFNLTAPERLDGIMRTGLELGVFDAVHGSPSPPNGRSSRSDETPSRAKATLYSRC